MSIRIGLAQWQHPHWKRWGLTSLADYARYFNCVEGNTTLYSLPKTETVQRWRAMTDDSFHFYFKFSASISHQAALRHCDKLLDNFFRTLDPLASRIGQYWLQLPASFSPCQLTDLWIFLDSLPRCFTYGVEVRHRDFFAKGEAERHLNQGLQQRGVNRVMLDTRAVHASCSQNPAAIEARSKKPKVPVHVLRTGQQPMVRFIGSDKVDESVDLFTPWLSRLTQWQQDSIPTLFIHTPDMGQVFPLVQALWPKLRQAMPSAISEPDWPRQETLF